MTKNTGGRRLLRFAIVSPTRAASVRSGTVAVWKRLVPDFDDIHPRWSVWARVSPIGLILHVGYIRDDRIVLRSVAFDKTPKQARAYAKSLTRRRARSHRGMRDDYLVEWNDPRYVQLTDDDINRLEATWAEKYARP
jgi:hypothetical protein